MTMCTQPEDHLRAKADALLRIEDLTVDFKTKAGIVQAVSSVTFDVMPGETVSIVGESGSGKSTLARAVTGLIPQARGQIIFKGSDLLKLSARKLRATRPELQMIFQDPIASLNPRRKVQDLVAQGLHVWPHLVVDTVDKDVDLLLLEVGMKPSAVRDRRAAEFSGGQCQRIAIARALAMRPKLVVCDEPVSALDVSVQAQILNLLRRMKASHGLTLLFISHDLSVVRNISDRVIVMYLGKVCEMGHADELFTNPSHPYTKVLLDSVPNMDPVKRATSVVAVEQPSPLDPPSGCRFRTRCPIATELCAREVPRLRRTGRDKFAACHHATSHEFVRPTMQ